MRRKRLSCVLVWWGGTEVTEKELWAVELRVNCDAVALCNDWRLCVPRAHHETSLNLSFSSFNRRVKVYLMEH